MKNLYRLMMFCAGIVLTSGAAHADALYALAGNSLLVVDTATPGTTRSTLAITGLQPGESLVGIDVRPATGELFGVGSTSRVYVINPLTGAATMVGAGPFAPALSGTSFGVDFNPVPDRIRVVSDTGQNLRLNPNSGAVAATDTPLNGAATSAVGAGYTNSFAGATTTTLYVIDAISDNLYLQGSIGGAPVSPNGGTLTLVGPLGVNTSNAVGLDISTAGTAFAALNVGGVSGLYTINLATGTATLIGTFAAGGAPITGIALAPVAMLNAPRPIPTLPTAGLALLALLLGFGTYRVLRRR